MHFLLKYFYFVWILNNFEAASEVLELSFKTMALGHSGILIYWEPVPEKHAFFLEFQATGNEKQTWNESLLAMEDGQYMIHSLAENTEYAIIIKEYYDFTYRLGEYRHPNEAINTYNLTGKTDLKTNSIPAKPAMGYLVPDGITVIPCGKERDCDGKSSGTHFLIKIKTLESRHVFVIEISDLAVKNLDLLPGRIHEIVVTSVNGDFQTDSDPQEICLAPFSSTIRAVKVLSLNESSLIVSWKVPKESVCRVIWYKFYILSTSNDSKDRGETDPYLLYLRCNFEPKQGCTYDLYMHSVDYEVNLISGLTPGAAYVIYIVPYAELNEFTTHYFYSRFGIEYIINYIPRVYDDNLPLAVPDVSYKIINSRDDPSLCEIHFQWLPCGKMFDCKNARPGDSYIFEYKKAADSKYEPSSKREEKREVIHVEKNQSYNFKVTSVRGSNHSSTFSRTIKVNDLCEEIVATG